MAGAAEDQKLSDQGLVERIASGKRDALGELYDRYASIMMAVGIKRIKDRPEVEDVLHDVFMEVWRNARSYDPERASVRTWLLLLMRSRTLDAARKVRRNRLDSLEDARERDDAPDEILIAQDDPSAGVDHGKMRQMVAQLPERLRHVLALTYFTGLTSGEVAEKIEIPRGTVKSRLRAARKALREAVLDGDGDTA